MFSLSNNDVGTKIKNFFRCFLEIVLLFGKFQSSIVKGDEIHSKR